MPFWVVRPQCDHPFWWSPIQVLKVRARLHVHVYVYMCFHLCIHVLSVLCADVSLLTIDVQEENKKKPVIFPLIYGPVKSGRPI